MNRDHVLIADNDRAVSSLLAEVLRRAGFRVLQAFDGQQAFEMTSDPRVGLLVCDLDMPRLPGLELLESLAVRGGFVPDTVVISGYLDASIEGRLRPLSFVRDVRRKPFDLMSFVELVRGLLAQPSAAVADAVVEGSGGTEAVGG